MEIRPVIICRSLLLTVNSGGVICYLMEQSFGVIGGREITLYSTLISNLMVRNLIRKFDNINTD